MLHISYYCSSCEFVLDNSQSGFTYVQNDQGKRILCSHPGEIFTVNEVLAKSNASFGERVGFNSYCICLECLNIFELDLKEKIPSIYYYEPGEEIEKYVKRQSDERLCPHCSSSKVKTILEMVGQSCPKCHQGRIVAYNTGWIA